MPKAAALVNGWVKEVLEIHVCICVQVSRLWAALSQSSVPWPSTSAWCSPSVHTHTCVPMSWHMQTHLFLYFCGDFLLYLFLYWANAVIYLLIVTLCWTCTHAHTHTHTHTHSHTHTRSDLPECNHVHVQICTLYSSCTPPTLSLSGLYEISYDRHWISYTHTRTHTFICTHKLTHHWESKVRAGDHGGRDTACRTIHTVVGHSSS